MKRETFLEYVTRHTGFGRTHWTAAILIHRFGVSIDRARGECRIGACSRQAFSYFR